MPADIFDHRTRCIWLEPNRAQDFTGLLYPALPADTPPQAVSARLAADQSGTLLLLIPREEATRLLDQGRYVKLMVQDGRELILAQFAFRQMHLDFPPPRLPAVDWAHLEFAALGGDLESFQRWLFQVFGGEPRSWLLWVVPNVDSVGRRLLAGAREEGTPDA
jgi:hypothetical protein